MKSLKVQVGVSLDPDVAEKIKREAEKDERSFSQYVNIVLKAHLTELGYYEKKNS